MDRSFFTLLKKEQLISQKAVFSGCISGDKRYTYSFLELPCPIMEGPKYLVSPAAKVQAGVPEEK